MYYDNAATTPVNKKYVEKILDQCLYEYYGNPSSLHTVGQRAKSILGEARKTVAESIGCEAEEIIFTSGGSESNNLALKGFSFANDCQIITTPIEHKSVLETCKFLQSHQINKYYTVDVDNDGLVEMFSLKEILKTVKSYQRIPLVSIQLANSEIGTIQPIEEIAELVHSFGGVLHVDAVQAYGILHINVKKMGIDMMSVSGHKLGAPKGIGFLYKKKNINIDPLINGGGQENGYRAGTENVPYIAALAEIVRNDVADYMIDSKAEQLVNRRDYLENKIKNIPDVIVNGNSEMRLPGNLSVSFKDIDGETLMMLLDTKDYNVSNGSACNAGSSEPSYVLKAIKVDPQYINGTIRITLTPIWHERKSFDTSWHEGYKADNTDFVELNQLADTIKNYVNILRKVR